MSTSVTADSFLIQEDGKRLALCVEEAQEEVILHLSVSLIPHPM